MHFRATQVLSSLDGGSNFPPFSLIDIKMCRYIRRYSVGTGHFRVLVPTESILIPTGSLYTHRSQIVPPESKRHAHRGVWHTRSGGAKRVFCTDTYRLTIRESRARDVCTTTDDVTTPYEPLYVIVSVIVGFRNLSNYGTNNCWFPLARKWPTWKWTWIWILYGKIEKKCPRYFTRDSRGNPRDLNMCRTGRSAALSRGRKSMPPRRESMKLVVQQRKFT